MRYYVTYIVPMLERQEERVFRNKLLGSSHWNQEKEIEDGAIEVTVSVDERTASFITLKYNCNVRPNPGI